MRVVEGHVAAEVAHVGLRVEVRHSERLHQRGMGVAEFVPRDLDAQARPNWIQYPVGDVLQHVMMAGLRTKHQVVGSDMVAPRGLGRGCERVRLVAWVVGCSCWLPIGPPPPKKHAARSEERRVGKERRWWLMCHALRT